MDKEQLLEGYFSKTLNEQQERQFNALLDTDAGFRNQFDFEKNLQKAIGRTEKAKLKSKLRDFETDMAAETPVRSLWPNFRDWRIAASILLLVGLGYLGYDSFLSGGTSGLFEENFAPYPNTVFAITRSGGQDESLERSAFEAYEADDYGRAIPLFKELQAKDSSGYVDFYLGQAHLGSGEAEAAIPLFEAVASTDGELAPEALWYLSLAYLKQGNEELASKTLESLLADGRYKPDAARALLDELE